MLAILGGMRASEERTIAVMMVYFVFIGLATVGAALAAHLH